MLQVMGYKKVNVDNVIYEETDGGETRSARSIQTTQSLEWIEDRENINTYRLAEGYTGEFVPFS